LNAGPKKLAPVARSILSTKSRKMSASNSSASNTMNAAPKKVAKKVAAPAPVAEAVAAPAPVAVEAPKKAVKKVAEAVAAPVAAPVVVAAPVATEAPVASAAAETSFADEVASLQKELKAVRDAASAALDVLKRVVKRAGQDVKEARKNKRRARAEPAEGEVRKPSNFEKPVPITDELSVFLGGGKNNHMSRKDVNSAIHKYIKDKGLGKGQVVSPDASLRKLLGVAESDNLTIFNIQTYMKRHYIKPTVAAVPAA
jgi:chromatin remodeling complex protein RSC6